MRRTSCTLVGVLISSVLLAGACGDDAGNRRVRGGSGSGAGGEAAGAENQTGGSEAAGVENQTGGGEGLATDAGAGGGAGANTEIAGASAGGEPGCPSGPAGAAIDDYLAQFKSGDRIQARYYSASGMPDVFAGFFDTDLGQWCDFQLAADDKLRCLPRTTSFSSQEGYSDDTCETPIYVPSSACTDSPGYVREQLECRDKAGVRSLTAYTGPRYTGTPGNCSADGAAPAGAYTVGQPISPASFVEGEVRGLPGICRGSLRVVNGADGSRGPFEVWDIGSGAGCEPTAGGCNPRRRAFEAPDLYTDDTCETPADEGYASWLNAESCGPPDFIRPIQGSQVWYRPGPLSVAELYSGLGVCEPVADKPWIGTLYELGEAVPTTDLVGLEALSLGDGALQVPAVGENGQPLIASTGFDARFYSTAAQADCYLRQLSDGTLRCIPTDIVSGRGLTDEYNDANCTQPVGRCNGDDCPGKLLHDQKVDQSVCSSERVTTGIWRVKALATGYYRKDDTFPCYAGGDPGPDMWTLEAVDPTELPEASLKTAP